MNKKGYEAVFKLPKFIKEISDIQDKRELVLRCMTANKANSHDRFSLI